MAEPEDIERRVHEYIQLRTLLKAIDAEWEAKRKDVKDLMEHVSGKIQAFLTEHNIDSVKTAAGTPYISVRHTATLSDPAAFMEYVVRNNAFELLDRKANSPAVKAFVEKYKALPPGCNLTALQTFGCRAKNAKLTDIDD
jgi:hypothetical protein